MNCVLYSFVRADGLTNKLFVFVLFCIRYQWKATGTGIHMDVKYFVSDHPILILYLTFFFSK